METGGHTRQLLQYYKEERMELQLEWCLQMIR